MISCSLVQYFVLTCCIHLHLKEAVLSWRKRIYVSPKPWHLSTELDDVILLKLAHAEKLLTCTRDVLSSNLSPDTGYPEVFRRFPQSLEKTVRIVARIGHSRFLPDPLQSFIHCSSYHTTLCSVDTETASLNNLQKIHDCTSQKFLKR
jgi:hypothetical protein